MRVGNAQADSSLTQRLIFQSKTAGSVASEMQGAETMYSDAEQQADPTSPITLRDISANDLPAVNRVLAAAITTWDIAPRVRRLALSSLQYKDIDFQHLTFSGAWHGDKLVGFVSIEPADPNESPDGQMALLVHGLYVIPEMHGRGIGGRLVDAAKQISRERGFTGLLVRAERNAKAFFQKLGFAALPVGHHRRDYPHRLWATIGIR